MAVTKDICLRYSVVANVELSALRGDEAFRERMTDLLVERRQYPLPLPVLPPNLVIGLPWIATASRDGTTLANVGDDRVEVRFEGGQAAERGVQTPTQEQFLGQATELLTAMLESTERSANRLGFVLEDIATDRIERPQSWMDVGRNLLRVPEDDDRRQMNEWLWRYSSRAMVNGVAYNSIATLSGIRGAIQGAPFTGVLFQLDSNTAQEDTRPRFMPQDLPQGLQTLLDLDRELSGVVDTLVGDFG